MPDRFILGSGGTRLAVHRLGSGRPVLLLHGLFSSADVNWIRYGTAQRLADAGSRHHARQPRAWAERGAA